MPATTFNLSQKLSAGTATPLSSHAFRESSSTPSQKLESKATPITSGSVSSYRVSTSTGITPSQPPVIAPLFANPSRDAAFSNENFLGKGGQASVYKVMSEQDHTLRALKVYAETGGIEFRLEAALLRRFNHPNIISLIRAYKSENRDCLELEYTPRTIDLEKAIRQNPINPKTAIQATMAIASAIQHAYNTKDHLNQRLDVVHGDIKPSNVLLTPSGQVKLIDFGIATTKAIRKKRYDNDSMRLKIAGTAQFMDPKVTIFGNMTSHQTDTHALAITFIELLLGEHATELLAGKYPHLNFENYNNGVYNLLKKLEKKLSLSWGKVHAQFIKSLIILLRYNLELSFPSTFKRHSASEFLNALHPLLEIAPGYDLSEFAENITQSPASRESALDNQKTMLIPDIKTRHSGAINSDFAQFINSSLLYV